MKSLKQKSAFIYFTLLLISSVTFAQKIDFSGTWLLKDQKSLSGILYFNGVPGKIKISQQKDKIVLEKTSSTQNNEDTITTVTLLFDGKDYETVTPSKRNKSISIQWDEDGKSYNTIITVYNTDDNKKVDFKVSDTWSLDNAGRLVVIRKNENFTNGETWISKSEYKKQ